MSCVVALLLGLLLWMAPAYGQTAPAAPGASVAPRRPGMMDAGPPPAPPALPHPATEAQLREFLQLTDASHQVHSELTSGLANMRARVPPYYPPAVLNEIGSQFDALDVVHIYLPWYQAYLSEQDMSALLAFYRTDAGKHYASVQGEVLSGAERSLGTAAQTIVQTVLLKHKDEIDAAKKAYEDKQTPAPK